MNLVHRKRYTTEFKAQAVELLSTGKPVSQVAEELCISSNLLYCWRHGSQGTQVGIVTAENTVHYQNVVVDRDLGSAIEISSGLHGNETLVRTPSAALPEGTRIQVAIQR